MDGRINLNLVEIFIVIGEKHVTHLAYRK